MANARKCDRCEKCFDPFNSEGMMCRFRNPMFQTSNDVREGVIGKLMVNDTPDAYIDLCPECAEMFETFMCGGEPPMPAWEREFNRKAEKAVSFWDIFEKMCLGKIEKELGEEKDE